MFTRNSNTQNSKLLKLSSAILLTLAAANVSAECVTETTHAKPLVITKQSVQCLPEADQFLVAVAENNLQRAQQLYRKQFLIDYRSGSRELIKFVNVRADKQNRYVTGRGRYEYASGTAYDIALSQGHVAVAKWLVTQGANPAAGFFQRQIEATDFAKYYPSAYWNLPYKERARLISAGVVLSNAVKENDHIKAANVLRIVPRALHYQNNSLLPQIIRLGKWNVAKAFLQHGEDVESLKDYVFMLRSLISSQPSNYAVLEMFLKRVYKSKKIDFFPLFMQALEKDDKQAMKLLVKYQTNINVTDKKPPLVLMAEEENNDMIRFLLGLGANPNLAYSGQYLIHRAIANDEIELARALIAKRVNVNVEDANGRTPLEIAMKKSDARLAKLLIDSGANVFVKTYGDSMLYLAAKYGKPRIAAQLMAKRVNIHQKNYLGETALLVAIQQDQLTIARALLKAGANPHIKDENNNSPMGYALSKKDLSFVKMLIAKKVNINKISDSKESPLMTAVKSENIPLVKLLISNGVRQKTVDKETGNTPLHIAVAQEDTTILQLLLAAKADVNAANKLTAYTSGRTALHIATEAGNLKKMRLLLNAGANVNVVSSAKSTPLHYAVTKGDEKLVQLLLAYKPKFTMLNDAEVTPLHIAVSKRNVLITRILLNAGANPNSVDTEGNTPLLTALLARKLDLAQYLLQKGAEVNVANNREKTPLDIALSKGLRKIAAQMRGLGAQTSVELGAASSLRVQLVDAVKK
jgi:ankyrin repeat protein